MSRLSLTHVAFNDLTNFLKLAFGLASYFPNPFLKGCFHLFIFKAGEINADVHRSAVDASAHRKSADADV